MAVPSKEVLPVIFEDPLDPRFTKPTINEIQRLIYRGTYYIVSADEVPERAIVLDSRMIHAMKTDAAGIDTYKSRIVIQGHKDPMKWMVVIQATTLLRGSRRLVLT